MKAYMIATKNLTLGQGARTPILTKSNFEALLTPGGLVRRTGIKELCPSTPLIEEIESKRTRHQTIFTHTPKPLVAHQTPRTRLLYANDKSPSH